MANQVYAALRRQPSDVADWIRTHFKGTLDMPDVEADPNLLEAIISIASNAFHTNFVEDSNYVPDGLALTALDSYRQRCPQVVAQVQVDLSKSPSLTGLTPLYLREYFGRFKPQHLAAAA
jgi:hypothetical protein